MATVRFATTCDGCGDRSEEYTAWPTCRECHADTCPMCGDPRTLTAADVDTPETILCYGCQAQDAEVKPAILANHFDVFVDGQQVGEVWQERPDGYWYADQQQDWANNSLNGALTRDRAVAFLVGLAARPQPARPAVARG